MFRTLLKPATPPKWLRAYERFVPDDPQTEPGAPDAPELLDEVVATKTLPGSPTGFIWFIIQNHFKTRLILLYLTAIVSMALDSFAPLALGALVDTLGPGGTGTDIPGAITWFAVLAGLWLFSELMIRLFEIQDIHLWPRMRVLTQKYLFRYLQDHSPRYFQDTFAGRLAQKVRTAGQAVNSLSHLVALDFSQILVQLFVSLIILYLENPWFAAALIVWIVLYLTIATIFARYCVALANESSQRWSALSGKIVDSISNMDAVRAFSRAEHERKFVSWYWFRAMISVMRLRWYITVMRIAQGSAIWIMRVGLIGFALWEVTKGTLTVGGFTAVVLIVAQIGGNLRNLSFRIMDFFEYYGTLTESLEIITAPHEIVDRPGAKPLVVTQGGIEFDRLKFAYADGTTVFPDLNLSIKPGEKVGIVGRSGAGKSTLIKLLRRQFEPTGGRILIDGQDILEVTWDSLNDAVAEVPQSPSIFHRKIRDNIRYADPSADEDRVVEAARLAHAHDFIASRYMGYDTLVGEQGIKLSGGERQRVSIARAFLKDARILVLDEATSALDSESEDLIQQALFDLMKGRTVIAIAHRLSTLTGMDRIIVLDKGRIAEQGSHDALLRLGGIYARLWQRQAGGFLKDR